MKIAAIVFISVVGLFTLFTSIAWYSEYSAAKQDIVLIEASKKNLEGIFDNTFKTINQSTQIAKFDRNSVKDIIIQHAQARTGNGAGGSVMKWVQESVPNIDSSTLKQLMNVINGARSEYVTQQGYYNDRVRVYNARLASPFIGSILTGFNGLKPLEYFAVSSTKTQEVFKSGLDNDVDLKLN